MEEKNNQQCHIPSSEFVFMHNTDDTGTIEWVIIISTITVKRKEIELKNEFYNHNGLKIIQIGSSLSDFSQNRRTTLNNRTLQNMCNDLFCIRND